MIEHIQINLNKHVNPEAVLSRQENGLQPALYINPSYLKEVCLFLRDTEGYYFDFLADLAAVDYFPEPYFEVVYHLTSMPYQKQLVLKVKLDNERQADDLPSLSSVSDIWRTADWHEREAFDLMGIYFEGHPDLRRILMPDDWEGYPLRKDYQDPEYYHGITVN